MGSVLFNPPPGARVNWGHPINRGLVACWLMNEGGGQIIQDIAGVSNGAGVANPITHAGPYGQARAFNGSSQYISIPNTNALNSLPAISISAWIYTVAFDPTDAGLIVSKTITPTGDPFVLYQLGVNSAGRITFGVSSGTAGGRVLVTSNEILSLGVWVHLAGTWDGATLKTYINGVQGVTTQAASLTMGSNAGPLLLGSLQFPGFPDYFNGYINNVRLFNRGLSAQEVRQLFVQPFAGINVARRGAYATPSVTFLPAWAIGSNQIFDGAAT